MDALIMDGKTLNAGAVGVIPDVRHPIDAARLVMECAPHVLLVGEAAKRFAVARGVEAAPPGALVTPRAQAALRKAVERGDYTMHDTGGSTVGAVAIDARGHLASATSTGGTSGKMVGRVGDTPLVGCGGYADDTVGTVSTTGHGESIIKTNLAHSIIVLMRQGLSAQDATQRALDELGRRLNNTAGAITLSNKGDVGVAFISKRMSWAYRKGNEMHYGIDPDQHCVEIVQEKENK
ncbi:Probable isoaspartyl peptidase/L-asparaginase CG7860 [Gryllus bimaculatus]|nr:Probable isoaspartyl peptidase/L-asparaginase CG7860 [Gryllus bimaculatus]